MYTSGSTGKPKGVMVTNQNVVRIHIRANSNSEADQQIKLKVRDDVLAFVTPLIAGCKDSDEVKNMLASNTQSINQIADNVLIENGFDYIANSRVSCEYFPSRNYNGTIFEADYYDALIVNLGSGEGNNWWCVAYPPLCFVGEETGGNVVYKHLPAGSPQGSVLGDVVNIDVKLGVIGEHNGNIHNLPKLPCHEGRHDRAVAVEQLNLALLNASCNFRREGDAGGVANHLIRENAGIPHHGIGIGGIVVFRIGGRDHQRIVFKLREEPGIIHHGVGNTVNQRRKGVVQETNGMIHRKPLFQQSLSAAVAAIGQIRA